MLEKMNEIPDESWKTGYRKKSEFRKFSGGFQYSELVGENQPLKILTVTSNPHFRKQETNDVRI